MSSVPPERLPAEIEARAARWQSSLDLGIGTLVRAVWFGTGSDKPARLLLIVHHLAVDGVSWRILLEDLEAACRQAMAGETIALPPRTLAYRDWAGHLQALAKSDAIREETAYWDGITDTHSAPWPVDDPQGSALESASAVLALELDAVETAALLALRQTRPRLELQELLLTALAGALAGWLGSDWVVIDLEGHGREDLGRHLDLSRTVGWFTCLHPVALRLAGSSAMEDGLKAVREQWGRIPHKGLGYGLLRHAGAPDVSGHRAGRGQAGIVFNYLGRLDAPFQPGVLLLVAGSAQASRAAGNHRPYEIEVNAWIAAGRLRWEWGYSAARYREATVRGLADDCLARLRGLLRRLADPGVDIHIPGDFPLAGLAQPELDRLARGRVGLEDVYPLTALQQGMLFHTLSEPDSGMYIEQASGRLRGIDPAALIRAWRNAMQRHPILRTAVAWEGLPEPLQTVETAVRPQVLELDWRGLDDGEQDRLWEARLAGDGHSAFELRRAPLWRLTLARLGDDSAYFAWTYHHIILDGWSGANLLGEVFAECAALMRGEAWTPPSCRPFREYAAWLRGRDASAARAYWRERLRGFTAPTGFGIDRPGGSGAGGYAKQLIELGTEASAALQALAKSHRLTLNTLFQGAWALLLGRCGGNREVVFGATVAGRPAELAGVESMLGLFINTVPLRMSLAPGAVLADWLMDLQAMNAELRQFEPTPLVEIQAASAVPRELPLFESHFVFENYPLEVALHESQAKLGAGTLDRMRFEDRVNFPLSVVVTPAQAIRVMFAYGRDRFDDAAIARLAENYRALLLGLPGFLARRLDAIPALSAGERRLVIDDWNRNPAPSPSWPSLHAAFEQRARAIPDAVAVECGGQRLNYRELDAWANRLAQALHARGIGPEVRMGLCVERSPALVVGILGILKAGAAYVPIDPAYPEGRIAFILEDAGIGLLLTQADLLERLPPSGAATLCLDRDWPAIAEYPDVAPRVETLPGHLAYVIYTSGSTGKPKGVAVAHANAVHSTAARHAYYPERVEAFLLLSSFAFDSSVAGIFWTLGQGGKLCLPPEGAHKEPMALLGIIARERVSHCLCLPSFYRLLLERADATDLDSLRAVIVAGEACPPDLAARHDQRLPRTALYNEYGPTEGSVWTTAYRLPPGGGAASVPIGGPIPGVRTYVLDRDGHPLPLGAPGELYIGGPGLARGYLDRPGLTAERFLPDPFGPPGGRLYRTGDLARWREDGTLEFLGRIDQQVKLRGYRIEPGEIEAALLAQPGVGEAAVLLRADAPGLERLVAYVTPLDGAEPDERTLLDGLRRVLPDYMVPSALVVLDRFPLTPNGKLDREALPAPEALTGDTPATPPPASNTDHPVQAAVARILAETLGLPAVGPHDNFFDLGGHSLLAIQVVARVQQELAVELPVTSLFDAPTAALLTEKLLGESPAPADPSVDALLGALAELDEAEALRLLEAVPPEMENP